MEDSLKEFLLWLALGLIAVVIVLLFYAYRRIKIKIWDDPQKKIQSLDGELYMSRHQVIRFLNEYCNEDFSNSDRSLSDLISLLVFRSKFTLHTDSSLKAIPYMAGIMADYETLWLKKLANQLDCGASVDCQYKVASINKIKKETEEQIAAARVSQYQLSYILHLYPILEELIDMEYSEAPSIDAHLLSDYDSARDYLSSEEYNSLSTCERNQLALDRYHSSHKKTKWQIGRDYELYVGFKFKERSYKVDLFGSYMGVEDLGRDIIAKKDFRTLIIQCKYWSKEKEIHENHINQLYGTLVCYCIEHHIDQSQVTGVLVTNITLSHMAKKFANYLGIEYVENYDIGEYPCIKCNVGKNAYGQTTKIYHLPFDQQYDRTIINEKDGDFMAMTVKEAEDAGFRRAFKWFGSI